jgi:hypothetical protein
VFGKLRLIFSKLHVIITLYITTLCCNNEEPSQRQSCDLPSIAGDLQRLLYLGYATCFTVSTVTVESKGPFTRGSSELLT